MPYWGRDEKRFDYYGTEVKPGYILESLIDPHPKNPWRYYVCYDDSDPIDPWEAVMVRDLNANNVGICRLYFTPNEERWKDISDVRVIGHITEVYEQLEREGEWTHIDWEYYFHQFNSATIDDTHFLRYETEEELENTYSANNFPKGWRRWPEVPK